MYNKHDLCKPNVQGIWLVYCHDLEPLTHCLRQTNAKQPPRSGGRGAGQPGGLTFRGGRRRVGGGGGWRSPAHSTGSWLRGLAAAGPDLPGFPGRRSKRQSHKHGSELRGPAATPVPGPSPSASPHPQPLPPPGGAAFGGGRGRGRGRAPIRPPLTLARRPGPSHPEKVLLAIIKVIKPPKSVGCWF